MPDPTPEDLSVGVREALIELQRYLSDSIAPLMVSDSIDLLLGQPPELAASEINAWVAAQFRGRKDAAPVSDYFFHALEKIHQLGQYDLVAKEPLARYLQALAGCLLETCPEEDRDLLRSNLARLGQADTMLAAPVEILHRQAGSGTPLASSHAAPERIADSQDLSKRLRRFSILLERWEATHPELSAAGAGGEASAAPRQRALMSGADKRTDALLSQILQEAATGAQSDRELARALEELRGAGVSMQTSDALRVLGRALPAWSIQAPVGADSPETLPQPTAGTAIGRIVTLPEDTAEVSKRFHELVLEAVEQFNKGSLPRAARMFDVAARLVAEKKVEARAVESSRKRAADMLDSERLRAFGEDPVQHASLRQLLGFFPALAAPALLRELEHEENRERRRMILALLEVHGAETRTAAVEQLRALEKSGAPKEEWHYKRNLLHLLRRIPRPSDESPDAELECLVSLSEPSLPPQLVKEAIANLGLVRSEKAEAVLISRIQALERMLQKKAGSPFDEAELQPVLDRAVGTLARFSTSTARRVVVEQGLKKKSTPGDEGVRLADLAGQDLSGDPELVTVLLKNLKEELPFKMLGLVLKKNEDRLVHLVDALSSTPTAPVRKTFADIVQRFPGTAFAASATKALAVFDAPRAEESQTPSLTGDLELFGLPGLLQSLAGSEVTGVLTLREQKGAVVGTMTLEKGRIRSAKAGNLQGDDACYQLLERPITAGFKFVKSRELPARLESDPQPREVVSILLEGMRRYDEFQRMAALVPDEMTLAAGGTKPTPHPEETDPAFQQAVWSKAIAGASPRVCESVLPADAYRIRRLMAHWLEEGSLKPGGAPATAGAAGPSPSAHPSPRAGT